MADRLIVGSNAAPLAPRKRWTVRTVSRSATGASVVGVATTVLFILALIAVPNFSAGSNLRAMFLSVALIGIVAVGLSLITIVGKVFTLSVPSLIALSTITFASTLSAGPWIALLVTMIMATAVGLIQGLLVGLLGTDPIITTIAAAAVLLGIGQLWTAGRTVVGTGDPDIFNSLVAGIAPFQVLVFAAVTAALTWWHRYSTTGRHLTLVGLNARAAAVSGLQSWPVVVLAFVVSGTTTGLAGALLSAQSGQGTLLLGSSFGFDAIVAVVVGGVGIKGGVGSPTGAAIGAVFVGLLGNILALVGLTYELQLVVKGVLVLMAVTAIGVFGTTGRRV